MKFFPLEGPNLHSTDGFYPHSESTTPFYQFVTHPLQNPIKFAGTVDGIIPAWR